MQRPRPARPGLGKGGRRWRQIGPVVIRLPTWSTVRRRSASRLLSRKREGRPRQISPLSSASFETSAVTVEAPLWQDHRFFQDAESWTDGEAYRLQVRGQFHVRYGMQVEILGLRPRHRSTTPAMVSTFSTWCPTASFPADELKKEAACPDRSLHRASAAQVVGRNDPRRARRPFLADACGSEFPPFVHVRAS